jgi:hypothetical protein
LSRVDAASPSGFAYVKAVPEKDVQRAKNQEAIRVAREATKTPDG